MRKPFLVRPRLRFIEDPTPADPAGGATPPAKPGPPPAAAPAADAGDEPLGEPGKKALEAERTARTKAQADLAAYRKEIDDSKKTAEQKAADDLAAAQKDAATSAAKALRYEVAAEKGLDLKFAARLTGSTKEELEADADALMALIPGQADPLVPRGPSIPTEGTGDQSKKVTSQVTEAELASMSPDQIVLARRAGRLSRLLGIPS